MCGLYVVVVGGVYGVRGVYGVCVCGCGCGCLRCVLMFTCRVLFVRVLRRNKSQRHIRMGTNVFVVGYLLQFYGVGDVAQAVQHSTV